jgi:hypothetical protein
LEPLEGATVRLYDLETGSEVARTTTDDQGQYSFRDVDERHFGLEATKTVGASTLKIEGVVSTLEEAANSLDVDLDPETTVAAKAVKERVAKMRAENIGSGNMKRIGEMFRETVAAVKDAVEKDPDKRIGCDDDAEVDQALDDVQENLRPSGHYVGEADGDGDIAIGMVVEGNHVMIVGLSDWSEHSGDDDSSGSRKGSKSEPLIMHAQLGEGGEIKFKFDQLLIMGYIDGEEGAGVWRENDNGQVETGTWSIEKVTDPKAGVYLAIANQGDARGYGAVIADDDGEFSIMAGAPADWSVDNPSDPGFAEGTVNLATGVFSFTIENENISGDLDNDVAVSGSTEPWVPFLQFHKLSAQTKATYGSFVGVLNSTQ